MPGIEIRAFNVNRLRYADDTISIANKERHDKYSNKGNLIKKRKLEMMATSKKHFI